MLPGHEDLQEFTDLSTEVPPPFEDTDCMVIPGVGVASETKFHVTCTYSLPEATYEIFSVKANEGA